MNHQDPAAELRGKLLSLTYRCPKEAYVGRCPFAMLQGLSEGSRRSIFNRMNLTEMAGLFDLVPHCSCPADPRRALPPDPSAAGS